MVLQAVRPHPALQFASKDLQRNNTILQEAVQNLQNGPEMIHLPIDGPRESFRARDLYTLLSANELIQVQLGLAEPRMQNCLLRDMMWGMMNLLLSMRMALRIACYAGLCPCCILLCLYNSLYRAGIAQIQKCQSYAPIVRSAHFVDASQHITLHIHANRRHRFYVCCV